MDKVVVISGGSDGLGKSIAQQLSKTCNVVILSPSKNKLENVSKEIGCSFEICDVSDYKSVNNAVENILKKYKRIDCLINNSGIWIEGQLEENDPEKIRKAIDVNTTGVLFLTKAVIPQMKKQSSGRIINIVSQAGLYAKAERSVYSASKWALTGFTKSMELELKSHGIGVIGVYPGKMKTEMFAKVGIKKDMSDGLDTKDVARTIEFILSFGNEVTFPEIGIKNLKG
ncbi:MAG: SDR family oxidoreductase [bacterium]|nr:SDR family oxidoreductase [bacterium]